MTKPFLPYPKSETERDEKFLEFIKNKPCLFCHEKSDPHHESGLGDSGGMALKCSDYFAINLCRYHHDQREREGFDSFWVWHHKNPWDIIIANLSEYAQLQDDRINIKRMTIDFLIERINDEIK